MKWPNAGEVLGGTHLRWGLGRCLEPPHTHPANGSRRVVMRSGPCCASLRALREGVCRQVVCVWGEAAWLANGGGSTLRRADHVIVRREGVWEASVI